MSTDKETPTEKKLRAVTLIVCTILFVLLNIILCSCSVKKEITRTTQKETVRDTVYIDRREKQTEYRHDTITYTDTITEFVRDSTGVWQPSKKTVSAGKATGAGITTGEKTAKERRFSIKSTDMQGATYSKEVKRTSFWWYLICLVGGIVLGIAGVAAVRCYFKRL